MRAISAVVLLVAGVAAGCARHAASQATTGALESLNKGIREEHPGEEHPAEIMAGRAIEGAIAKLSSPEQMAEMEKVAAAAAAAAVRRAFEKAMAGDPNPIEQVASEAAGSFRATFSSGLAGDLGEQGPLATSVSGAVRLAAASAVDGAFARVFPGCTAEDADCLDRRIAALSREAAVGFGAGLKHSLGIAALVLAFLAGAAVTLMVVLLIQLEVKRREHHEVARAH